MQGLDWLAVGNGWRNLFLLSCAVQAVALGTGFAIHRLWVRRSRLGAFLAGVSVTPLVQYVWMLLLAAVWPQASKWVYIGVLPALAGAYLLGAALRRVRRLRGLAGRAWAWGKRLIRLDRAALIALCFTLAMGVLLAPIVVRLSTGSSAAEADSAEYMALAQRYCEDRSLPELLDKDDPTGHFRGNAHFPSMELYMAYGLMHTGGAYGYPYDKPLFTGLGLLTLYLLAAYVALLIQLTGGKKRWIFLGLLLFNLIPNYVYALSPAVRDNWRCLALVIAAVAFAELSPEGGVKKYLGKLIFVTGLCFAVMSTHVVCFVVLPFIVVAWVLRRWLLDLNRGNHQGLRTLLRAAGLALGGAVGTLAAYAGNLWCYVKWGEMSPWRLMTTYTSAPWYAQYMEGEYKLEATTRHLNFWQAKDDIVRAYATPVGIWGLRLAVIGLLAVGVVLIVRHAQARRTLRELKAQMPADGPVAVFFGENQTRRDRRERVLGAALLTVLTLAPMSGLLDTKLYSFSGSFLTMQRYTLQWFMFAGATIAAVLAALEEIWPDLLGWGRRKGGRLCAWTREKLPNAGVWARRVPALLCVLLCVFSFVQGTKESGYANSFYRYGRPMLTDESTALDNAIQEQYGLLFQLNAVMPEQEKILVTRPSYQYALRARGYVLTSNPIVPLMNLPLDEVGPALDAMQVGALCTEADFWDERYYALSTLSTYLNALPQEQIVQQGNMRVYLLDTALVGKLKTE